MLQWISAFACKQRSVLTTNYNPSANYNIVFRDIKPRSCTTYQALLRMVDCSNQKLWLRSNIANIYIQALMLTLKTAYTCFQELGQNL